MLHRNKIHDSGNFLMMQRNKMHEQLRKLSYDAT